MDRREVMHDPAAVLTLAEQVCPSLNGPASFLLTSVLEATDAEFDAHDEFRVIAQAIDQLDSGRVDHWRSRITDNPARLVTVLDPAYPTNLRMVPDRPPLIWVRGTLDPADERAIAVVGTRQASAEGSEAARRIATSLAARDVTVVSGLAAGIDTEAHIAALEAGGRTLAVLGTGTDRTYPSSNRELAGRIAEAGATISQFWPDMSGTRWSFPVRNIVTSGLSLGTVVVEAGPTSGARYQAEHALQHGKRVFLLLRLVEAQPWAKDLADHPGVCAIADIDDIDDIFAAIDLEVDADVDVLM